MKRPRDISKVIEQTLDHKPNSVYPTSTGSPTVNS